MNTTEQNKMTAYRALKGVCDSYKSTWRTLKAFSDQYAKFVEHFGNLETYSRNQGQRRTGVAQDKKQAREEMVDATIDAAASVIAWASTNKNHELTAKVNFSRSTLLTVRDVECLAHCKTVHDAAEENLEALADYGVTEADLEALQGKIDGFDAVITKPREVISKKSTITAQVREEIDLIDEILNDRLDKLVVKFRVSNPEFVRDYQNARIIVDASATRNAKPATTPTTT